MDKKSVSIVTLVALNVFLMLLLYSILQQVPTTPNTEFKIVAYVAEDINLGRMKFVIRCENTGLEKEYWIGDYTNNFGKLFYMGYLNENVTIGEDRVVGGISCTPPFYKGQTT